MQGRERIQPYQILYDAIKVSSELIERFTPEGEMITIKSYVRNGLQAMEKVLQQADEGKPIIGYHFAFPGEILHCFDVVPFCFEAVPYVMAAVLPDGA